MSQQEAEIFLISGKFANAIFALPIWSLVCYNATPMAIGWREGEIEIEIRGEEE